MSHAAYITAGPYSRPLPYTGKTYQAFRVTETPARTRPVQVTGNPRTIDEAVTASIGTFIHKEKLLIREADEATGETRLHLFAIKKAAPKFVRDGFATRRVEDLYAEKICEIEGGVLA